MSMELENNMCPVIEELEEIVLSGSDVIEDISADAKVDDAVPNIYTQIVRKAVSFPLLKAEEEVELSRRIENGDRIALETLVNSNLRLVISIAKRYASLLPIEDLIQEGNMGLMKAAGKYNWRLGYRFSTYATCWIRNAIVAAIAQKSMAVHIPSNVYFDIISYRKKKAELAVRLGAEPSAREVAEFTEKSISAIERLETLPAKVISLEQPVNNDDQDEETEFVNVIEDKNSPAPEKEAVSNALTSAVECVLDRLSEREAKILKYHYGLCGHEPRSYEEIARNIGLSKERVRQIEKRATLRIMSTPSMSKTLRDFYYD